MHILNFNEYYVDRCQDAFSPQVTMWTLTFELEDFKNQTQIASMFEHSMYLFLGSYLKYYCHLKCVWLFLLKVCPPPWRDPMPIIHAPDIQFVFYIIRKNKHSKLSSTLLHCCLEFYRMRHLVQVQALWKQHPQLQRSSIPNHTFHTQTPEFTISSPELGHWCQSEQEQHNRRIYKSIFIHNENNLKSPEFVSLKARSSDRGPSRGIWSKPSSPGLVLHDRSVLCDECSTSSPSSRLPRKQ